MTLNDKMMNYTTVTPQFKESVGIGERSLGESVIVAIIVGIIQIFGLFGNLLVIACIRVYHRLRWEVGSLFIVNLSVADVCTCLIVMTSSFYSVLMDVKTVDEALCDFVCCMNYTLIIVSMLTLGFISLDRYLAVVHALRYHSLMNQKFALFLISWAWFQGFVFGLAPVFANWIHYDYWEIVCAINWADSNLLIYVIVAFLLCFLIPGLVLAILYCKVMSVAKTHIKNSQFYIGQKVGDNDSNSVAATTNNNNSRREPIDPPQFSPTPNPQIPSASNGLPSAAEPKTLPAQNITTLFQTIPDNNNVRPGMSTIAYSHEESLHQNQSRDPNTTNNNKTLRFTLKKNDNINYSASRKALRSFLAVVLAYFICMTPFSVTKLYKAIASDQTSLPGYVNLVSSLFQFCSSAINPLIYGILRKDFKVAFKILLHRVRPFSHERASINSFSFQ